MKKHRFYITILILIFLSNSAFSKDIYNSFLQECQSAGKIDQSGLNYSLDHFELLRESRNDTLLSRYALRRQFVSYSQKLKNLNFKIDYKRNILDVDDLLNNDYTKTTIKPNIHSFDGKIQFKLGNYDLLPGMGYSFSKLNDTLFIKDYPVSEERIYNNYFFDLLPGTFGDSIIYQHAFNRFNANLYIENMNEAKGFSFYVDYSISNNRLNEKHLNRGNVEKLRGPRESLMHLRTIEFNSLFSLKVDTNAVLKVGLSFDHSPIDWSHTVFPNDPDTLEIIKLSYGKINSFSGMLGYEFNTAKSNFDIALKLGRSGGSNHLATPVLGYVFGILPIAHQGDINFTTTYLQLRSHIDGNFDFESIKLSPRFDILSGYYFSQLNALALLQFGIEDIDIDQAYQHFVLFASPGINTIFYLNSDLYMNLDLSQMLPFIKQIKPKSEPIEPSDIKRYGGLSVSLGVGMSW